MCICVLSATKDSATKGKASEKMGQLMGRRSALRLKVAKLDKAAQSRAAKRLVLMQAKAKSETLLAGASISPQVIKKD